MGAEFQDWVRNPAEQAQYLKTFLIGSTYQNQIKEVKFALNVYGSEMLVPSDFNFYAEALKNVQSR